MDKESHGTARDWAPRSIGLLLGTLVLATAFIAAYVGALHQPTPRDLPIGVVSGDQRAQATLDAVRGQTTILKAVGYDDPAAAEHGLLSRAVYAVLSTGSDNGLLLTVASASGPSATSAIKEVLGTATGRTGTPLQIVDKVPVTPADPRGVVPFYLNVGYVLGGYLASTVLGISAGTTPRTARRAGLRIAALAVYSVLLGIAGAVVVGPVLDIWHHDVPTIAAIGALAVFAAAMFASAIQGWLGVAGTALVILLLVVLGNPGSGGIYAPEFLPGVLRGMHRWNIPGLANDLTKAAVYFDWRSAGWPAAALGIWTVLGGLGLISASLVRGRRAAPSSPEATHPGPSPDRDGG
ncbi:hypothetical protein NIE79_002819 [Micromonospora sp. NIE79]|uniref:DUF3533 domain-containing protein n=1 Tax=Micromonospora trifolii TaxID=2911208 RepID=A0ABS9N3Y8_9ACTN|nr:hypothetical protein [Micromonospora trifolii]MCG5444661.1 hypothetical protein [Micromonospora trifolii]